MGYPNFRDKHLEQALFEPQEYLTWKKFLRNNKAKAPRKYVFVYYPEILNHFKRKYKPKRISLYRLITVYQYKNVGVVRMTGIGSPHAVTVLEELIAMGGEEFVNIGFAGGLRDFGIFLCEKSIRDEGTSHHYVPHAKFAYPDKGLTSRLEKRLRKNRLPFQKATSWTIDAPYRETKAEIRRYKSQGVATVEMESSALFTVARVRRVKMASAFVVSDILGEKKWDPQFDARHVHQRLNELFTAALDCFLER